MAIIVTDRHGHYGKNRKANGPKLDRATARSFARVANRSSKGYVTRREALDAEAEMRVEFQNVTPKNSAMTIAEFGDQVWLPVKRARLKTSSLAEVLWAWKNIGPAIGAIKLRDLTAADLRSLYADLGKRGPSVAEKAHKHVVNLLGLAVNDQYLTRNVARGRDVAPKKSLREMQCWDPDQVRVFLDAMADDRLFACWRLGVMTGMRRAELLGLHWDAVDLDAGRLHVKITLVLTPDGRSVWEDPKTERSRRVIDLDPVTVAALKRHRVQQAPERLASLGAWPTEGNEADLVFTDKAGSPLRPAYLSRRFGDLVRKINGLKRIRLHDLRHTHATILLSEGLPVHVVSARLGHKSPSITLDTYAHVLPDQATDAATRFAAAIDG